MYKSKYHNITCKITCTYIPESHLHVLTQIHYYQNITFTLQNQNLLQVDSYCYVGPVVCGMPRISSSVPTPMKYPC